MMNKKQDIINNPQCEARLLIFAAFGEIAREGFERNIYEGDGDGEGWLSLNESTIYGRDVDIKRGKDGYPKATNAQSAPLYDTGHLFFSATSVREPDHISRVEGNTAAEGVGSENATLHNKGGTVDYDFGAKQPDGMRFRNAEGRWVRVMQVSRWATPKRKFIYLDAEAKTELNDKVTDILTTWFNE